MRYPPDHALQFLARAERKWNRANQPGAHPIDRCEDLLVAMARALNALATAEARQITHTHDLVVLWEYAERSGNRIPVARNDEQLNKLTLYAEIDGREDPADGAPEAAWNAAKTTAEGLLNHARATVPTLVEQTRSKLGDAEMPGPGGGAGEKPRAAVPDRATLPAAGAPALRRRDIRRPPLPLKRRRDKRDACPLGRRPDTRLPRVLGRVRVGARRLRRQMAGGRRHHLDQGEEPAEPHDPAACLRRPAQAHGLRRAEVEAVERGDEITHNERPHDA